MLKNSHGDRPIERSATKSESWKSHDRPLPCRGEDAGPAQRVDAHIDAHRLHPVALEQTRPPSRPATQIQGLLSGAWRREPEKRLDRSPLPKIEEAIESSRHPSVKIMNETQILRMPSAQASQLGIVATPEIQQPLIGTAHGRITNSTCQVSTSPRIGIFETFSGRKRTP